MAIVARPLGYSPYPCSMTIPEWASGTVKFYLWGAGGGGGGGDGGQIGGDGGGGGYAAGTISVAPGDKLTLCCGQGGYGGVVGTGIRFWNGGLGFTDLQFTTRSDLIPGVTWVALPSTGYTALSEKWAIWSSTPTDDILDVTFTGVYIESQTMNLQFASSGNTSIWVDGVLVGTGSGQSPYPSDIILNALGWESYADVTYTGGTHTVRIRCDSTGVTLGQRFVSVILGPFYNGGVGGRSGPSGSSGQGGGGGGATVLKLNQNTVAIAAGGGGGGGAGLGSGGLPAENGSRWVNDNPTGQAGQDKSGDGGGGGGGGGGFNGGKGGPTRPGDSGAYPGSYGGSISYGGGANWQDPYYRVPAGTLYRPYPGQPIAVGGLGSGSTGTQGGNGYAYLEFNLTSLSINTRGIFGSESWDAVSKQHILQNGVDGNKYWYPIAATWVHDGTAWKSVTGSQPPFWNWNSTLISTNRIYYKAYGDNT